MAFAYPEAPRDDVVDDLHGRSVADPYRWLEDVEDPRTRQWSAAQDELTAARAAGWSGRDQVTARLTELMGTGAVGTPVWRGERHFFGRRTPDQEHAVLLVVDHPGAEPRTLIDPMTLDPSGTTTLDAWQPNVEGDLLAYQVSSGGTEESVLHVMDVATGEDVDGPIDRGRYSPVAWLPRTSQAGAEDDGGIGFYYVRRLPPQDVPADEAQYHRRVWWHRVGTDPDTDVEVFGAGLAITNYYGAWTSRDGRWLVLSAAAGTAPRNDLWIADLQGADPARPALQEVAVGLDAQSSAFVGRDGRLYIETDLDAPRGRVCVTTPQNPGPDTWTDLLATDPEAVLEDIAILDGPELDEPVLLAGWTRHAVSRITTHRLVDGTLTGEVALPGLGSTGGIVARREGGHEAWFGWGDHTTPTQILRYDARTGEVSVWATSPGTAQVPDVVTRQIAFTSPDGTTVRMFVTARADLLDGEGEDARPRSPMPTILYGYGGFGISLTPGYSPSALTWVEAGGVYVVANLRGGGEEGESWHRDGMMATKQNVFDDFHAAADALVAGGWTTPEQLCAQGGSNGGLLVGAALTQRPQTFAAIVCSAPLLDMVRYEKFGLGVTWNEEYGTAADPEQLDWLLSYSPYHRVTEGTAYPATLFTVFDGDSRVDPLHARKLCAALQHATTGSPQTSPILLRREKDVGHGARSVSRTVALSADTLLFSAAHTGLAWT